jgi:hypothetical protein
MWDLPGSVAESDIPVGSDIPAEFDIPVESDISICQR